MKKLKSLALAFALAVGGVAVTGGSAHAQSVPLSPQGVTATAHDLVSNNYVAPEVVDAVSQLPLSNVYYRAGRGFTTARVDQTGENVGIEYQLDGGRKTPLRAYNLDDPAGAAQFRTAVAAAGATENALAREEARSSLAYATYYPAYTYVRPVQPLIIIGPAFRPWNNHHHHNIRHVDYRHHGWIAPPRVIQPRIVINTHNHRNDRHYSDHNRGNRGGRDHRDRGPGHRH